MAFGPGGNQRARPALQKQLRTLQKFIEGENTLALATVGEDGAPRVAALFYLPGPALQLYWFSSAASEHSRALEAQPEAAVSIYRQTDEWKKIRGAQLRGPVRRVTDPAQRAAISKAYARRFRLGKLLQAAMAACELYQMEPRWARYTGNAAGFGRKFELHLPAV